MSGPNSTSIESFNDQVVEHLDRLLHANGVFKLGSYGWIDADTYDPDLIGHAMNQTDSLSWRYLLAATETPTAPSLTEWQKSLIIAGGDFEGLMEAARLSIGLMLFQDALPRASMDQSSFLSLHLMSAMLLLGAASDRLWDFFVSAVFNKPREQSREISSSAKAYYAKGRFQNRDRRQYSTAFYEASEHKFSKHLDAVADSINALPEIAQKIELFRSSRNGIVHRIATEQGQQQFRLVSDPPSNFRDNFEWSFPSEEVLRELSDEAEAEHRKSIAEPISWYKLLIEASNHIFVIENALRANS